MPASPNRVDPLTVAHDANYAAGLTLRGLDLRTFDPMRAILAERFAAEAKRCHGDTQRLAAVILPQLADAVRAASLQIENEGRMSDD